MCIPYPRVRSRVSSKPHETHPESPEPEYREGGVGEGPALLLRRGSQEDWSFISAASLTVASDLNLFSWLTRS